MQLPEGRKLASEWPGEQTFLFDCRSVPPPRPNLVYIFEGVCNRSGFLPAPGNSPAAVRGCPVTECPYNITDEGRLLSIRDHYHMLPVANLSSATKPVAQPTDADTSFRVRCLKCAVTGLFALDEDIAANSQPLRYCPFCGVELQFEGEVLTWSLDPAEKHGFLWLSFAPAATQTEAECIANQPALDLGQPVCDTAKFFPGANLDKQDFHKQNLSFAKLEGASFRGANIAETIFMGAVLNNADFSGATLAYADFVKASATGASFRRADLTDVSAVGANFQRADLVRADLKNAYLSGTDFTGAKLAGTDLSGANLNDAILIGADLAGAILRGARLIKANLEGANLTGADLTDAVLEEAVLIRVTAPWTKLERTILKHSVGSEADFSRAHFEGADLSGAVWNRATVFRSRFETVTATAAVFEFADLRESAIVRCNLTGAVLRGADLRSAVIELTKFDLVDTTWVRTERTNLTGDQTRIAPSAAPGAAAFGPADSPPLVEPKPLYRLPVDESDRFRLMHSLENS